MTILAQGEPAGGPLVSSCLSVPRDEVVSRDASQQIRALFQQHGPVVYRRALRLLGNPADAEEATQEIFIRALRAMGGFQHRSQMTTWLYRIATHYCLNLIRDRARRTQLHAEHVEPMAAAAMAGALHPDERLFLRKLLASADERQAAAAVYVFIDGMSHEEAASVLGVSKRTVGNLIERFQAWVDAQGEPPAGAPAAGGEVGLAGAERRRS